MQVNLDFNPDAYTILGYNDSGITLRHPVTRAMLAENQRPVDTQVNSSCIVFPERLIEHWPVQSLADLTLESLSVIHEHRPEVLLIGTGNRIQFPAPAVTAPLMASGIGVEIMDNGGACRTYNILMTEGRRVAVALIIKS